MLFLVLVNIKSIKKNLITKDNDGTKACFVSKFMMHLDVTCQQEYKQIKHQVELYQRQSTLSFKYAY